MLQTLQIENVVLIDRAEVSFGAGLNVLTGETGAGKSIVVDAISAISGGRTPRELIRTGEDHASVTAELSDVPPFPWFEDNGVEPPEDGALIITRKITLDGKNSVRVNGAAVTVAQLRELGSLLLDIHGQNDGRRLLDERAHLASLDAFGGHTAELDAYRAAFTALRETEKSLKSIIDDAAERERRADALRYQIDEIAAANLAPGESKTLEERRAILANASRLSDAFDGAYAALYGGEDTDGASALLREAERSLEGIEEFSEKYAALLARVRDLRYNAEDAAEELRGERAKLDFSPEELDETDARLDAIRRVTKKYGGDESAALDFLDKITKELDDIEFSDERKKELERERALRLAAATDCAAALTTARIAASERLRALLEAELRDLAMPGVRFEVELVAQDALTANGAEDARFLMSANAGEAPGRISKIASGGELSRIMLALKNVLSESDGVPVAVFDEIDAGVSGVAAQRVGEKLSDLARGRQVLCVTHLPQIAAMADTHFGITKSEEGGRTVTDIENLDLDKRVLELSRLTGGENVTETVKNAAREQLAAAQKYKSKRS
ncbi:MAG: DNA repair protein RecN [Oscillospiraceae bacterium]|jgi:DNA repair protein RecN (Recombination protein N)|nr:DNA repair protein RecN [Oscillospiraceae bacterium]